MLACDLIVDILLKRGIDAFFVITGGAIVPLIDALGRRQGADSFKMIPFQHEQAAAMAAEGYWRETGRLAAVIVTSGPGIQNVLNGLCGCFYDSIPMLVVSGQVNTSESLDSISSCPRQRGFQEMPVVESFKHFCVYAKKLMYVNDLSGREIFDSFNSAITAATTPRFGPALIDLPVNIQMAEIPSTTTDTFHTTNLVSFKPPAPSSDSEVCLIEIIFPRLLEMLSAAERPLIIFGAGVRASSSCHLARTLVEQLDVPFCLTSAAKDLFEDTHHLNCGSHGVYGSRAANIVVQNCDVLFILGSRLDTRQTGGSLPKFAQLQRK